MGLLIKLENGDTSLKSLKFGKDRIGGGDSGQPYIQTPIDGESGISTSGNTDFLLRGGIQAPLNAAKDVARLTKYMFSTKSPSGLLFIAKQNLLSRVSPKTEASKGPGYAGGNLNAGVYTPLSTLAQVGVGFLGIHLNKQGLNPFDGFPLSINKYEDVVKANNESKVNTIPVEKTTIVLTPNPSGGVTSKLGTTPTFSPTEQTTIEGGFSNRLLNIWYNKQFKGVNLTYIDDYEGGPGSILGIGKTKIRFADQRTGVNNPKLEKFYSNGFGIFEDPKKGSRTFNTKILLKGITTNTAYTSSGKLDTGLDIGLDVNDIFNFSISSTKSGSLYTESDESAKLRKDPRGGSRTFDTKTLLKGITTNSAYTSSGKLDTDLNIGQNKNPIFNFSISSTKSGSLYTESDESKNLRNKGRTNSTNTLFSDDQKIAAPNSQPTYLISLNSKYPNPGADLNNAFAIETRLALGDPGRVTGSYSTTSSIKTDILDKINASPIYQSGEKGRYTGDYNDIVSFRIGIISPTSSITTHYMNFRAYIDSFSDSYSATWKGQRYMGRAEEFYKYDGFGRDISLAFTVVAHSQGEMHGMYQKLNFLASSLAPTYTSQGYMAGNLAKLTLGDYIHEQPGFISSITYDIPEESSWELSKTPEGQTSNKNNPDELPFMIKVTGFKFTPIHNFRPEIQLNPDKGYKNRFITNNLDFQSNFHNEYLPRT
jgi:hypothetical protein